MMAVAMPASKPNALLNTRGTKKKPGPTPNRIPRSTAISRGLFTISSSSLNRAWLRSYASTMEIMDSNSSTITSNGISSTRGPNATAGNTINCFWLATHWDNPLNSFPVESVYLYASTRYLPDSSIRYLATPRSSVCSFTRLPLGETMDTVACLKSPNKGCETRTICSSPTTGSARSNESCNGNPEMTASVGPQPSSALPFPLSSTPLPQTSTSASSQPSST